MIGKATTETTSNNAIKTLKIEGEIFNWFPKSSNNTGEPELGDPANGRIDNTNYQLSYNEGDAEQLTSWNILNQEQLY